MIRFVNVLACTARCGPGVQPLGSFITNLAQPVSGPRVSVSPFAQVRMEDTGFRFVSQDEPFDPPPREQITLRDLSSCFRAFENDYAKANVEVAREFGPLRRRAEIQAAAIVTTYCDWLTATPGFTELRSIVISRWGEDISGESVIKIIGLLLAKNKLTFEPAEALTLVDAVSALSTNDVSENGSPRRTAKNRRGPKVKYDPKSDAQVYDAMKSACHRSFHELANERKRNEKPSELRRASDRHRKRLAKRTN